MKKTFWIGFTIGVFYFLITYAFEVLASSCSWKLQESMCGLFTLWANVPSFLVTRILHLPGFSWLVAIPLMNGLILGGIFVLVRKIFQKRK
jgi:hypothetical protein